TARSARVHMRTTLRSASPSDRPVVLRTTVYDSTGRAVASTATPTVAPRDSMVEVTQEVVVPDPNRWSVDRPYLYRAVTSVECGDAQTPCDDYTTPFGIRTFEFRADSGFFLNGQHVKIRGVCLHHVFGALGSAVNERALE